MVSALRMLSIIALIVISTHTGECCHSVCMCVSNGQVNCERKGLTDVPDDLPMDTTHLSLAVNDIIYVNSSRLERLKNLRKLTLNRNPLVTFPSSIQLLALIELHFASTKLSTLQLDGAHLPRLQLLSLVSCPLKHLNVSTVNSLATLNIENIHLTTFPVAGFMLPQSIETLWMSNNPLKQVNISTLPNLRVLHIRNCSIKHFPHPNFKLTSLSLELDLSRSPLLKTLNVTEKEIPNVKKLSLRYLQPSSFTINSTVLTFVFFQHTSIECLSEKQLSAPNLWWLDVRSTGIELLDITSYKKLQILYLGNSTNAKLQHIIYDKSVVRRNKLIVNFVKESINCTCCLIDFFRLTNSTEACMKDYNSNKIACDADEMCNKRPSPFCGSKFFNFLS